MMKIRSIYFDKADLERLEEVAKKRRTNVSAVIREVMASYLRAVSAREEKRKIRT